MNLLQLASQEAAPPMAAASAPPPVETPIEVPHGGGLHGGAMETNRSMIRYANATVKQIVLLFDGGAYAQTIKRLQRIRRRMRVETNTEAFLCAVAAWEEKHGFTREG